MSNHPLAIALALAVPLELALLRDIDDELRAQTIATHTGRAVATLLGEYGDQLQYGGPRCSEAFAGVARGLACLAWAPGGVTFAGMHFCARHELCEKADAEVNYDTPRKPPERASTDAPREGVALAEVPDGA
jgi:hypothetical protein